MPQQRISYVPLDKMDERMRAEMTRCQREGTPRPESSAVRAHVPACFWFFAESWHNIFRNGVLDHAIKELCRLYVSRSVTCEYCGNQRSVKATTSGALIEEQVLDLLNFEKSTKYDERQKTALAYAEAIVWRLDTGDDFWERMHRHFTDAGSVRTYLPSIGPLAPLNGSVVNPLSTASGAFGGEVLGLEFNVDFSDAGLLPGSSGLRFGDLVLENFSTGPVVNQESFNGLTVRQFLGDENILLSGGSTVFSIADLGTAASDINGSFSNGIPTAFAQDHLVAPASPVPEPSTLPLLIIVTAGLAWVPDTAPVT